MRRLSTATIALAFHYVWRLLESLGKEADLKGMEVTGWPDVATKV